MKKEQKKISPAVILLGVLTVVAIALGTALFLEISGQRVYIEKAQIVAPVITVSSPVSGVLDEIFVKEGDHVERGAIVATVDMAPVQARTSGLVVAVKNTPGQITGPQDYIIRMIDPRELRVVGSLEENKGLRYIRPGQQVIFTADAFDGKKYYAIVEDIAQTARQGDIVFSISDKRQQSEFDIKARFDADAYPELKNGMSAKMWVQK